jgi:hypothetical protein
MPLAGRQHPIQAFLFDRSQRSVRRARWTRSASAADANGPTHTVRVVHPFHPLHHQTFPLRDCRLTWGEARVYFHPTGAFVHRPAQWTDAVPADPFLVVGVGRAAVRLQDLGHLRVLLDGLLAAPEESRDVK